MDDLSAKLSELLNDPESMNRVRQMAESILGEEQEKQAPPSAIPDIFNFADMPTGDELQNIISIISKMKNAEDDNRVKLINALRPHLSYERQKRADTAVKILKLLDMWPLIKESGLLQL